MVRLFQPRWTNIAVEVSLFHVTCPAAWDGMVTLERDAYDAAKRAAPAVPRVFKEDPARQRWPPAHPGRRGPRAC